MRNGSSMVTMLGGGPACRCTGRRSSAGIGDAGGALLGLHLLEEVEGHRRLRRFAAKPDESQGWKSLFARRNRGISRDAP